MNADHSKLPIKENTSDHIKWLWLEVQEHEEYALRASSSSAAAASAGIADSMPEECHEGFALRVRQPPKRLTQKQTKYLSELFWDGQLGKTRKANPEDVAKQMKLQRDEAGAKYFAPMEWLTDVEISRFFTRMTVAVKKGKVKAPTDKMPEEIACKETEGNEQE